MSDLFGNKAFRGWIKPDGGVWKVAMEDDDYNTCMARLINHDAGGRRNCSKVVLAAHLNADKEMK